MAQGSSGDSLQRAISSMMGYGTYGITIMSSARWQAEHACEALDCGSRLLRCGREVPPMISINQLLLSLVVLVGPGDAAPSPSDCAELSRALRDREDIYWKVYKGRLAGDHLAEGRKIDALKAQLRECAAQPKPIVSSEPGAAG